MSIISRFVDYILDNRETTPIFLDLKFINSDLEDIEFTEEEEALDAEMSGLCEE